ncbi:MAG: PTS sugar transporter subunit IIA [bacterium]|nr:PTS sugar transporter subunit IIA [bacterium]
MTNIKLGELIESDRVLELDVDTKEEVLRILCDQLAEDPRVLDGKALYEAIMRREHQISTGVGMGIAIPHVKIPQVNDYVIAVGRIKKGVDFGAMDGRPVHLVFMIAASDHQTRDFVRILAQVTHLLKHDGIRQALLRAEIPLDFLTIIQEHEG